MSTSAIYHRPAAIEGSFRRFFELTMTLARSEFKLRYYGSALGYLWSLMRPLLFFGVLYLFFTKVVDIGKGVPHYGVYLLTGIVLWTYFGEATAGCVNCLVARESLLRKVRFPRMVVPLSVSMTAAFNLGMNLIAVVVFALANGVTPTIQWLVMIPIVLGFVFLATGIGMLLAALYVRFRDIQPIWDVGQQIWFYGSPIMFTAHSIAKRFGTSLAHIALINPVGILLTGMGHAFINPNDKVNFPSVLSVAGDLTTIVGVLLIPLLFTLGWWVFTREAPRVAEYL